MTAPTIYHYHGMTGEFLGSSVAELDPIGGLPLIPQFATTIAPPAVGTNRVAVFENGGWTEKEDHRGTPIYSIETGQQSVVTEIGPIPEGFTTSIYPGSGYVWQDGEWVEGPPTVPEFVTPLQARKALRQANLYDTVMAWISQQSDEVQETWEYALEIRRDNPIIAAAAAELELTEQQVDDLFIAAAQYD